MDRSRISACTYPVRLEPLEDTFGLISRAGFAKVDLWGGPPNYSDDPAECDAASIAALAGSYGVSVANVGTYPGRTLFEAGFDSEIRTMRNAIDQAVTFGARSIRVSPGHDDDPSNIPTLVPFFAESAKIASGHGIFLGMENHLGSIASDPELVMRLVSEVDSPMFGILYEPANLMACRVDYREAYEAFRGHIVHVHIKDSRWIGDRYERTMLGEGEIDIDWVTESLEGDGYDGDYALEYEIEKNVPVEEGLPVWFDYFSGIG